MAILNVIETSQAQYVRNVDLKPIVGGAAPPVPPPSIETTLYPPLEMCDCSYLPPLGAFVISPVPGWITLPSSTTTGHVP
jgi:hypothetical protein